MIPILHWPTFEQEYTSVYEAGSLHAISPIWTSLLFSVLAVGVLFSTEPSVSRPHTGKEFIETSRQLLDLWNDDFVIDHARTAILTSVFLAELNLKSAAWTWLASAVRIGQDIGLHCETGPWPLIEGEMRRRVWWGIYVWDRHMSLELGRPLLIEDDDCDVALPVAVDDHYIHDAGLLVPSGASPLTNLMVPVIHVVRAVGPLIKTLKAPVISPAILATFDAHFASCMLAFPLSCHLALSASPTLQTPLDPRILAPVCYLTNARLIVHRHNLSTYCPHDIRVHALEQCIKISVESANLIERAMNGASPAIFGKMVNAMTCTHIWRCTLFLLYGGCWDAALRCIRASAAVGTSRNINVACGRNIAFLLSVLIEKRRNPEFARDARELDEEVIAYVSGDVQASTERSWVWLGSETAMNHGGTAVDGERRPMVLGGSDSSTAPLNDAESREWGGWERVEYLVDVLARERAEPTSEPIVREPPRGLAVHEHERSLALPSVASRDERKAANERMSITNII